MRDHCVFVGDLSSFVCERCQARELVALPCSVDAFTTAANAFIAAHAGCVASDTMRGQHVPAETIVAELVESRAHASRERPLRDVGSALGVSYERVRQWEAVALAKLRAKLGALGLTAAEVIAYLDTLAPGHVEPPVVELTDEERKRRRSRADRKRRKGTDHDR